MLEDITDQTGLMANELLVGAFVAFELLALLSVPSVLLRRRGHPSAALAWIFALFTAPPLAALAWWLFGRTRLERKRRKRAERRKQAARQRDAPRTARYTRFDSLLPERAHGESAFFSTANHVQVLRDGGEVFSELARLIESAEHRIHVLMYTFEQDATGRRIAELLAARAREGIEVRLLLDGFGTGSHVARLKRALRPEGVLVETFLASPLRRFYPQRVNFTNHRKIIAIDDRVALTGGMNIGAQYEHEWRDLMLRVEGPAAQALGHVFAEDWYYATAEAVPALSIPPIEGDCEAAVIASGPDTEPWIHDAYFLAITRADRRVHITTPYFVPTAALLAALRTAAGRGVDVRLILPSKSDVTLVKWASRSYYRPLVDAGVRIFEYEGPMLHAKSLVQDDAVFSVGTANLDNRSFGLSFEVSCFVASTEQQARLARWQHDLLEHSVEITAASLDHKGVGQKLVESAAHLLSPLL